MNPLTCWTAVLTLSCPGTCSACHPSLAADDVWFINRPPVFTPEAGVRKFVARDSSGQVQGFIFFDGVYENGQLTGYYANVTRMRPDAHPGTLNLVMKEFIHRCSLLQSRMLWMSACHLAACHMPTQAALYAHAACRDSL